MNRPFTLLVIIVLVSCQTTQNTTDTQSAEILGAQLISSDLPEFATSISPNGDEIFFNRTSADRSSMWIMSAKKEQGNWKEPIKFEFSTGEYLDVDPFISHDGTRLYFTSNRPTSPDETFENLDTWYIERTGDKWSDPINAGTPLNSDSTEIFISMAKNGNAYFVSERDGIRGIKISRFENGTYQETENLVLKLRGEPIYASNPCIASDEEFIIVAARDPQGNNTPDLFVSWNKNGAWSELQNLGPLVNDPLYADFAPGLSKDNKTLLFTSERPGIVPKMDDGVRPPGDLYQVDLEGVFISLRNEPTNSGNKAAEN